MNDSENRAYPAPNRRSQARRAETTGDVARASGVQIGLLLLLVLVNLLVIWVLWSAINGG